MNAICFSLEGPLAAHDNVLELMRLFPGGDKIFETIARYDNLLTVEGRPDYEPGDIPVLIAPFLVYHGIREEDIAALARKTTLTDGATDLIFRLSARGWNIFCISHNYAQYALHVAQRLSIFSQHVTCTSFPLSTISQTLCKDDFAAVETLEQDILKKTSIDDAWIKRKLDRFYWKELPKSNLGTLQKQIIPVNGQHKVEALERFGSAQNLPLSDWVTVGSSITDSKLIQAIDQADGLAIAFNASEPALSRATMGLASTHLNDLWPVLEAWRQGKRTAVQRLVKGKEKSGGSNDRNYFHWLADIEDVAAPLEIHQRIRSAI